MTSSSRDALIVGGGVIGTASAFRLALANWRVTVFDPAPGLGASFAAAGMVAPSAEIAPGEEENFRLQRGALNAWRTMSADLARVTGQELELVAHGTLLVGFDASDRRLVNQFELVASSFGVRTQRATRSSHDAFFQSISPRINEGLFLEGDAWLDPDRAMSLLVKANESLGVSVLREEVVLAGVTEARVEATTTERIVRGDVGVLATGARPLPGGVAERVANVIRPVRGMTVRVQGVDRSSQPTLRAFVRGRPLYMVSRPGGYCVLGASSEEQRELVVEVGELQRLLRDALDIVPSLEGAAIVETRQGLRPASKDLAPFFEVVDNRWAWISGHFRHGVTLAPLAANEALAFAESLR
ncbi:MAG: FAD-dependent oxidoreductase [Acidimicrobiales bacterium]